MLEATFSADYTSPADYAGRPHQTSNARVRHKLAPYIEKQSKKFHASLKQVQNLEKNEPSAAARLYMDIINLMKKFDIHCPKFELAPERPMMPIKRLNLVLERNDMLKGCLEAITWYTSYPDPVDLSANDREAIKKRYAQLKSNQWRERNERHEHRNPPCPLTSFSTLFGGRLTFPTHRFISEYLQWTS